MDKYIKREDLGEALDAIARVAMENADALWTDITIRKSWRSEGGVVMAVNVADATNFKKLKEVNYFIVGGSDLDVVEVFAEALAAQAAEQNVESNNEEE